MTKAHSPLTVTACVCVCVSVGLVILPCMLSARAADFITTTPTPRLQQPVKFSGFLTHSVFSQDDYHHVEAAVCVLTSTGTLKNMKCVDIKCSHETKNMCMKISGLKKNDFKNVLSS